MQSEAKITKKSLKRRVALAIGEKNGYNKAT